MTPLVPRRHPRTIGQIVRGKSQLVLGLVLFSGLTVVGCGGPTAEGPGGRRQHLALTPQQELALGTQAYQEILSKSKVVRSGPKVDQVRRVGRRIVEATTIEPLMREIRLHEEGYRFAWEFNIIESDQINAFCLPGGKVAVYTGLFRATQNNEDQLATVMSHEIAHALAHHVSERLYRAHMLDRGRQIAGRGVSADEPRGGGRSVVDVLAGFGNLPFERQQESEADHIGIFLMTFAGYDPHEALAFWERMRELSRGQGRPPEILSDHPSDEHRIKDLQEWVPRALGAKEAYDQGKIAPVPGGLRKPRPRSFQEEER